MTKCKSLKYFFFYLTKPIYGDNSSHLENFSICSSAVEKCISCLKLSNSIFPENEAKFLKQKEDWKTQIITNHLTALMFSVQKKRFPPLF